jgi:peptide chain release factor 1
MSTAIAAPSPNGDGNILALLADVERRYDELDHVMADPAVATDPAKLQELGRERAEIEVVVGAYRELKLLDRQIAEAEEMRDAGDVELAELAEQELTELRERRDPTLSRIRALLVPKDPNDDKNVIVEIRAGTGGDEAALFAGDLFRMYTRYAERNRWKVEVLSATETDGGGFREIIFEVRGKGAYSHLRYESGVHRVQRVPVTESQGRIHTSTASVAVLPEAEEVDVQIDENDLRIDVYRSTGHGGQSVNTTDSAVRIVHLPTGIIVTCQDEKSQLKNKLKAMTVLRSRLYEIEQQRLAQERGEARRSQIGSGDRSEKIRTYNFPQDRVTDHRIGLTKSNLPGIMQGQIDQFIQELRAEDEGERLRDFGLDS